MERRRDEAEVPAWAAFVADTRRAARVWRDRPGLPLFVFAVHLALGLVVIAPVLGLLAFPVFVFLVGFVGSERLWYLHAFSGWSSLSAGDLWNAAWGYFGRFFVLGLTLAPIFVVSGFLTVLTSPAVGITINALIYIGIDLVLTFVTPALAFTDRRGCPGRLFPPPRTGRPQRPPPRAHRHLNPAPETSPFPAKPLIRGSRVTVTPM